MKILIIMDGFFPGQKYGGPPVSVDNFCSLMTGAKCYIVTHNHDLRDKTPYCSIMSGWNQRDNCQVLYLKDSEYNKRTFERIIEEIDPDMLYLQGLFQSCIVPCLQIARKHGLKVILAPRGELCKGAFKKKYKKIPYILLIRFFGLVKNIYYQSTSDEETEAICKKMGARKSDIYYLINIPSIPQKTYQSPEKASGQARLIFLSRIVEKKNLLYAIACLQNVHGSVVFDIYGALEDANYWSRCQQLIEKLPENVSVNYKGAVAHDEVHGIFSQYDAFLFPTQSENFGHVIIEALSVGCPAILSDQTPWIDLEKMNAGWALALNEQEKFVSAIQCIVDNTNEEELIMREAATQYVVRKLKLEELKAQYEKAFTSIL